MLLLTTHISAQKTVVPPNSNKITRYNNIKSTTPKNTTANKKQNIKKIKEKPSPGRKPKAIIKTKKE